MVYNEIVFLDSYTNESKTPIITWEKEGSKKEQEIEELSFSELIKFFENYLQEQGIHEKSIKTTVSTVEFWYKKRMENIIFKKKKKIDV